MTSFSFHLRTLQTDEFDQQLFAYLEHSIGINVTVNSSILWETYTCT